MVFKVGMKHDVTYQIQSKTTDESSNFNNSVFEVANPAENVQPLPKKYLEAQNRIEKAKQDLTSEINAVLNKIAQTDDHCDKEELRAQLDHLYKVKNIYANVKYEISKDGDVSFTFSEAVNVEDFKKAFGIKNHNLCKYLRKRHDKGVLDSEIKLKSWSMRRTRHEWGYVNTGTGDVYDDGCKVVYYNTSLGEGYYMDYTGMELGPEDNGLKVSYKKFHKVK